MNTAFVLLIIFFPHHESDETIINKLAEMIALKTGFYIITREIMMLSNDCTNNYYYS